MSMATQLTDYYAALGVSGSASQRTLHGNVSLSIPAGTQPGVKLRLKGQGIRAHGTSGDQFVEVIVQIPTRLTEKQKKMLEEWGE